MSITSKFILFCVLRINKCVFKTHTAQLELVLKYLLMLISKYYKIGNDGTPKIVN